MPVTQLDSKTALIVIDLQKGIVALPAIHPIGGIPANAVLLATAFPKSKFIGFDYHKPSVEAARKRDKAACLSNVDTDWQAKSDACQHSRTRNLGRDANAGLRGVHRRPLLAHGHPLRLHGARSYRHVELEAE